MKFFPSLCNRYYQSRDTRGDQRRSHLDVDEYPPSRRQTIRKRNTSSSSTTKISDSNEVSSRASRNGRFFADHQLSSASPSLSVPSASFEISKIKDKKQDRSEPRTSLRDCWTKMRVFPFYSAQSVASLDTFLARVSHMNFSRFHARGNRRELCAVIRQRDNKQQRNGAQNVEN